MMTYIMSVDICRIWVRSESFTGLFKNDRRNSGVGCYFKFNNSGKEISLNSKIYLFNTRCQNFNYNKLMRKNMVTRKKLNELIIADKRLIVQKDEKKKLRAECY